MILTRLFREFFDSEKAGGLVLVLATILSLLLANSVWGNSYINLWNEVFIICHIICGKFDRHEKPQFQNKEYFNFIREKLVNN